MEKILRRIAMLACLASVTVVAHAGEILVKTGEKVAFLGDSITQQGSTAPMGYVRLVISGLAANDVKIDPIFAGIGGHTSADMVRRVEKDVIEKKAVLMTLSCGINDVFRGKDGINLEDFKKNLTGVVDKAQAAGVKVVILTATLMNDRPDHPLNVTSEPYNDFLRTLAKERNLPLADLNNDMRAKTLLSADERKKNGPMTADGVHMATFGNQVMADGVLRTLGLNDAQLQKAHEAWKDIPNAAPVSGTAAYTLREYERLQLRAAKQNKTLNELVNEALKKYFDSLLNPTTVN